MLYIPTFQCHVFLYVVYPNITMLFHPVYCIYLGKCEGTVKGEGDGIHVVRNPVVNYVGCWCSLHLFHMVRFVQLYIFQMQMQMQMQ